MDSLCRRYANPFLYLDQVISCGRFDDFVKDFTDRVNDEFLMRIWLHRVFDKSFEDYKKQVKPKPKATRKQIEATVKFSIDLLKDFNLEAWEVK